MDRVEIARIMDAVRGIVRALRISTRGVEGATGISGAQLFVLQQLAEHPARSVNELAERTYTHQSSVSVVVSRLVERGLVTRQPSRQDGRRIEMALSPAGRALLAAAPETTQERLVAALHRLSPERRRSLAEGLDAWLGAAGLGGAPAPFFFEEEPSHPEVE